MQASMNEVFYSEFSKLHEFEFLDSRKIFDRLARFPVNSGSIISDRFISCSHRKFQNYF